MKDFKRGDIVYFSNILLGIFKGELIEKYTSVIDGTEYHNWAIRSVSGSGNIRYYFENEADLTKDSTRYDKEIKTRYIKQKISKLQEELSKVSTGE